MQDQYYEVLGNKLKEIREKRNLTLDEFSSLLNEDKQTYYNYERGIRALSIFKLEKYIKNLKLSSKEIFELLNIHLKDKSILPAVPALSI